MPRRKPTPEVTTASALYARDDTFRAGVAAWIAEKRCDLRLVDVLLEHNLSAQAEAARWAATQPDRNFASQRNTGLTCGPFPCLYAGVYYWYNCERTVTPRDAHDVPMTCFPRMVNYQTDTFANAADAILFLLDHWSPEGTYPTPEPPKPRRRKRK